MKCPNCGGDSLGNVCDWCGSELKREPEPKPPVTVVNNYYGATPQATQAAPKKKNTWLWVLGWICIFPVPATILLWRNKTMKPWLKYGLIAFLWLLYFFIGLTGNPEAPTAGISLR